LLRAYRLPDWAACRWVGGGTATAHRHGTREDELARLRGAYSGASRARSRRAEDTTHVLLRVQRLSGATGHPMDQVQLARMHFAGGAHLIPLTWAVLDGLERLTDLLASQVLNEVGQPRRTHLRVAPGERNGVVHTRLAGYEQLRVQAVFQLANSQRVPPLFALGLSRASFNADTCTSAHSRSAFVRACRGAEQPRKRERGQAGQPPSRETARSGTVTRRSRRPQGPRPRFHRPCPRSSPPPRHRDPYRDWS
jgi:hypothetical protein